MNLTLISHWFDTGDRVLNAISKCKRHSSVVIINEKNKQTNKQTQGSFFVLGGTVRWYFKKTKTFDVAKTYQQTDIPTKILAQYS